MIKLTETEYKTLCEAICFAFRNVASYEPVNYQLLERLIKLEDEFEKHKNKAVINIGIIKDGE